MAGKKNINLTFLIQLTLVGLISIVLTGYFWISSEISKFEKEIEEQQKNFIELKKNTLKREVDSAFAFVEHLRLQTETRLKDSIKNRVDEAHSIALNIFEKNRHLKTAREIEELIRQALRPVRFKNNRGYYFIFDLDGIEQLFPIMPEMEGKSMMEITGGDGEHVVPDMIKIAKKQKEGFYTYTWHMPGRKGYFPKIAFIKLLEPLNWVIGAGDYTEDVKNDLQQECLDYISKIRFGKDGYIFAGTWDGISLSGPAKGKNMLHVQDADGKKIVQELIRVSVEGGGYVEYVIPKFKGQREAPKLSYAKGVPDWRWYIGAGIYVDEIEYVIAEKRAALNAGIKSNIQKIFLILGVMTIFILVVVKLLSSRMSRNLNLFIQFFEAASTEKVKINKKLLNFIEFDQLADSANLMIEEQIKTQKDLKAAHERFLVVLDGIDATIYVADIETYEILFMNKNMQKLFGGDHTGRMCYRVFRDGDGICSHCNMDRMLDKNGRPAGLKIWQGRNPITGRWYVNYDRAIEWTDGRWVKLQIATDITEFKKIEEELRQAHKMESIGTLAGGIAHEFNNILSIIIGNVELALSELEQKNPAFKNVEEVKKAGLRAKDIVRQLLSFSRKTEQNWKSLDIAPIVKDSLKLVSSSIPSSIEIRKDIPDSLPHILADQTQLHQVIINLCTNAFQAIEEPDEGILDIRLKKTVLAEKDERFTDMPLGEYVELIITDNGSGIDPNLKNRIFDPYFTTKPIGEGTGMGLAIVHGIVQSHGGAIYVDSEPGKGSEFHIIFPVTQEPQKNNDGDIQNIENDFSGQENILFVDDETAITDVVEQYLSSIGYHITTSNSPVEALAVFEKTPEKYDLVISDMTMPQMNGMKLSKKIKETRQDIPIIICTGNMSLIDDKSIGGTDISRLAIKPLTMPELAELIKETLNPKS